MEDKTGIAGESIILGFTAWLWLLPFTSLYSGRTIDQLFVDVFQLNIASGAILLAFITLATAVLGIVGDKIAFILEKVVIGPTSNPRGWYESRVGHLSPEDWYAAQERIWSSAQAYKEFVGARLGVYLSRTLVVNCMAALVVLAWAALAKMWLPHFPLLASVAGVGLIFGLASWWISKGAYFAIVRVAGDMEKRRTINSDKTLTPQANHTVDHDARNSGVN